MPDITNGSVRGHYSGTGWTLDVTCMLGYSLKGEPVISCSPDGTWSAEFPECGLCH